LSRIDIWNTSFSAVRTEGSTTELLEIALVAAITALATLLCIWALYSSIIIIQEYEKGVYMRLGRYVKVIGPGLHLVAPFISRVHRVDSRVQTMELGRQEVMTKDLSPTVIESFVQYKLDQPNKSLLSVEKYRSTIASIAQVTLRKIALEHDLDDLIRKQAIVNEEFMARMVKEGERMGIDIIRTEFKEIDPVGPIKAAMEDRVAAERERQAMILRADGRKRAIMIENEGKRAADK